MRNFFGDGIHDKLFPNKLKRFTQQEKSLIDKFINSILNQDNKSDLEESTAESYNDRVDMITEIIRKRFIFKGVLFNLRFLKFFSNNIKLGQTVYPYELEYDGHDSSGPPYRDRLLKDFAEEGSITGILVKGEAHPSKTGFLDFIIKSSYGKSTKGQDVLGIRTRYDGGDLTDECKDRIEKFHLEIIKNAIIKKT
jgi:hypothetical protein